MNAGLKAVTEATGAYTDRVSVWQAVISMLPLNRHVDATTVSAAMRHAGLHLPRGEWTAILRGLGVLDSRGWLDPSAAAAVASALSFVVPEATSEATGPWRLVATVPAGMRGAGGEGLPVAQTEAVILGLLGSANKRVVMTAPFTDGNAAAMLTESLVDCGRRGVDILLMTSRTNGAAFAVVADRWPAVARVGAEFRCVESSQVTRGTGSHAKVVLIDGIRAYIGSANFTTAGMQRQFEVGAVVAGAQLDGLSELLHRLERDGLTVVSAVGRSNA